MDSADQDDGEQDAEETAGNCLPQEAGLVTHECARAVARGAYHPAATHTMTEDAVPRCGPARLIDALGSARREMALVCGREVRARAPEYA